MSGNDLGQLSDQILSGQAAIDKLPIDVRGQLIDYWKTAGVNFANPQVANQQLNDLTGATQQAQRSAAVAANPVTQGLGIMFKPISMLGSFGHMLYSNIASPAVSFTALAAHSAIYGYDGSDGSTGSLGNLWNQAHSISPGQAVWELGLNDQELKDRGISPQQMTADKALMAEGKYVNPNGETVDNPWGNKTQAQIYFDSGWQKTVSGGTDLAASWYLDPLTKIGKAAELAKLAKVARPVADTKILPGITMKGIASKAAAAGGTPEEIGARMATQSAVKQVSDKIMQIKNSSAPGTTAFQLRTQLGTLKQSTAGDALATLLAQAKDQNEVNRIMRISMGDQTALGNTLARQDELAANVSAAKLQISNIDDYVAKQTAAGVPANSPALAAAQQDRQNFQGLVSSYLGQSAMIDKQREAFGSVERLNFNKTTNAVGNYLSSDARWYNGSFGKVGGPVSLIATPVVNTGILAAKVIRSYNDIKPSRWIDVHSDDSWREVDASLQEAKSLTPEQRQAYVSSYMAANANQRGSMLLGMEKGVVQSIVDKYNVGKSVDDQISAAMANHIYTDYVNRRSQYTGSILSSNRSYSNGVVTGPNGDQVGADVFTNPNVFDFSDTGEALVAHPVLETQIQNTHQMMDFQAMKKAVDLHGAKFSNIRMDLGTVANQAQYVTDNLNHYWKAFQLLRPAYTVRALSDDFLGQVARFGAMSMVQRAIEGGKVKAQDFYLSRFKKDTVGLSQQKFGMNQQLLEEMGRQEQATMAKLEQYQPGTLEHDLATEDLAGTRQMIQDTQNEQAQLSALMAGGRGTRQVTIGRNVFAAPYGDAGGQMARDDIAGTRQFETMLSNPTNFYLRKMRQMGWGTVSAKGDESAIANHMSAWTRVLTQQVAKSYPGRLALEGLTEQSIANKLRYTPEGQSYVKDIGLVHLNELELAQRVKAHVDHLLNPTIPGMDEVRSSLLDGTFTPQLLKDTVPIPARPDVNGELWDYAVGKSKAPQIIDQGISWFYKWAGEKPSRILLRDPLFKQEYNAYLGMQIKKWQGQGITEVPLDTQKLTENAARKYAMQQVKRNTYSMTHETKMSYHLRNMAAFFGAQAESYNRWARIIADKPQTLGNVANAYNAPSRAGIVTDSNGNSVGADGYATDPLTGQRTFVPIGQRNMTIQLPGFLAAGIGTKSITTPLSSWQVVLQEGDGPLPVGAGPIVMMPLNKLAQWDPKISDWAQSAGLMPYGPQSTWSPLMASYAKKYMQASDPTDPINQHNMMYIAQMAVAKHDAGLLDTEGQPDWGKIEQKANQWSIARAILGQVSPFSAKQQDPYQFFRDEYNRLQQLDPQSADQKFLEKYGDSFFQFTASMSKNNSGLQATQNSVKLSQQWQDLINKVGGQYAGLVVGDPGDSGTYSKGAYYYEQNTPTSAGSTTMMRSGLSAQEAWKAMRVNQGWSDYDKVVQGLQAQLIQRGLGSFSDRGAQDLDQTRKNAVLLLTQKYNADGTLNKHYNEQFADAYATQDTNKYNQTANDLTELVNDPKMWAKAYDEKTNTVGQRSDIYTLRSYLDAREAMVQALDVRGGNGGSSDINARSNQDLRAQFEALTNRLIEADTKFQSIHTKYFANDMGYNTSTSPIIAELLQQQAAGQTQSLVGQQAPAVGEVGSLG